MSYNSISYFLLYNIYLNLLQQFEFKNHFEVNKEYKLNDIFKIVYDYEQLYKRSIHTI